ncbi:hypothetical protein BJ165DRAFT_291391 [Panaeolus papilionaceus]|nr:hypothetical protein BJ165DRAFT_291391 [Panaeolus papilionaceus]
MSEPNRVLITGCSWVVTQNTTSDTDHPINRAIDKLYRHSYPPALHNWSGRSRVSKTPRIESGELKPIIEAVLEWSMIQLDSQDDHLQPSNGSTLHEESSTQLLLDSSARLSQGVQGATIPNLNVPSSAEFEQADTRNPLILWLHGEDEQEITSIAHHVAQSLQDDKRLTGAYFFNLPDTSPLQHSLSDQREHENSWIATLAYQMAVNIPQTSEAVAQVINREPGIFDLQAKEQIKKLIVNPLLETGPAASTTEGQPEDILRLVENITSPANAVSNRASSSSVPSAAGVIVLNGIHHARPNDEAQLSIIHNITMALKTLHLAANPPRFPQKILLTTCTKNSSISEHLSTRLRKPYVQEVSWHLRILPPPSTTPKDADGDAYASSSDESGYLDYFKDQLENVQLSPGTRRQLERGMMIFARNLAKAVFRFRLQFNRFQLPIDINSHHRDTASYRIVSRLVKPYTVRVSTKLAFVKPFTIE